MAVYLRLNIYYVDREKEALRRFSKIQESAADRSPVCRLKFSPRGHAAAPAPDADAARQPAMSLSHITVVLINAVCIDGSA